MALFNLFLENVGNIFDYARRARLANRAFVELSQLSDRELQDLGLNRYDIPRVAWQNSQ